MLTFSRNTFKGCCCATSLKASSEFTSSVISRTVYDIACRREEEEKGEGRNREDTFFKKDLNSRRVKRPSPDSGRCLFVTWRLRDRSVHDIISQGIHRCQEPRYRTIRTIRLVIFLNVAKSHPFQRYSFVFFLFRKNYNYFYPFYT